MKAVIDSKLISRLSWARDVLEYKAERKRLDFLSLSPSKRETHRAQDMLLDAEDFDRLAGDLYDILTELKDKLR